MNELIFELEELIDKYKGITELVYALGNVQNGATDDYTTGIILLANLLHDNNAEFEKTCNKMYHASKA